MRIPSCQGPKAESEASGTDRREGAFTAMGRYPSGMTDERARRVSTIIVTRGR
jgi:hypothetical protein